MKKLQLLAATLLMASAVQAQQAIFERHDTRSPEFNADGTIRPVKMTFAPSFPFSPISPSSFALFSSMD